MYRPKNTPDPVVAPKCEQCHRSKVLTSDPDERWQCVRWTCRSQQKPVTSQLEHDMHKLKSAFVLLGAVEELRQTGQRTLENLAGDVATATNANELLMHLERGAENIVHAIAPVSDALRAFVVLPEQKRESSCAALEMTQCERCGVWMVGACKCGAL